MPFLGRIPLDPLLARSCDEGTSCFDKFPDSPATKALQLLVNGTLISLLLRDVRIPPQCTDTMLPSNV